MRAYMSFTMFELKKVAQSLEHIRSSLGARFGEEVTRLLRTVSSKKSQDSLQLKIENLERLSTELHELELRHGISLGETVYRFMHSFHRN